MAQANATQTFVCALTGLTPLTDAVVTPSGYVCSRKLLLTKLSENGGVDPFDSDAGTRRLDESSLVELNSAGAAGNAAPPRPPAAASLPSLLGMLQREFDAVLLELYDTRKALEETRRELSSALYQNDAAVRVVARVVKERDESRGRLEEFLRGDNHDARREAAAATTTTAAEPVKRERDSSQMETTEEEPAKKAKVEDDGPPDLTNIPASELSAMSKTWKSLSKGRKSIAKLKRTEDQTAANEKLLGALAESKEKKVNLGKSSAKAGVLCMAAIEAVAEDKTVEYVVSGGHDKTAIVYNVTTGQIAATLSGAGGDVIAVHGMALADALLIAAGSADGAVRLYSVPLSGDDEPTLLGSAEMSKDAPVSVTVHPSSTSADARVLVASSEGMIGIFKCASADGKEGELTLITRLESEAEGFASGCMHPDGLIYIAGTTDGSVVIWDLKTQKVAGTLKGHDGNAIKNIAISENGYHVATSDPASIHLWDLRKLKLLTSITPSGVGSVTSLAFDPTATYLAYSGDEAAEVCVVKDWERVVCTLSGSKTGRKGKKKAGGASGAVAWGGKGLGIVVDGEESGVWLATGCDGERPVRFWGVE